MIATYIPAHKLFHVTDNAYWNRYWDCADLIDYHAKVASLADALKTADAKRVFVISQDRAWFMAGVFAALYAGLPAVSPQSDAPELLSQLLQEGDLLLSDQPELAALTAPFLDITGHFGQAPQAELPCLDPHEAKILFYTSGSSGTPKTVTKTLRQVEAEVEVLEGLWGARPGIRYLSTVSHHHLYAFLYSLMWPVTAGRQIERHTFTYWGDLIASSAHDDYIISSPAHLGRFSVLEDCHPHPFGLVFSSGAPLAYDAAQTSRRYLGSLPIEVYGSTETGGIAYRQQETTATPWITFDCVKLSSDANSRLIVTSPYLEDNDPFQTEDRIQWVTERSFFLLGRADRILKIEGKRVSLIELENKIKDTGLVEDVATLLLQKSFRDELGAVAVLTDQGKAQLASQGKGPFTRELRAKLCRYFDKVLVPRKWRFVDEIPTNPQGKRLGTILEPLFEKTESKKLSHVKKPIILNQKVAEDAANLELEIPLDLAYLEGHFAAMPIVPGVVQLHWADEYARELLGITGDVQQGNQIKFTSLLRPLDRVILSLVYDREKNTLRYSYVKGDQTCSSGRLNYGQEKNDL